MSKPPWVASSAPADVLAIEGGKLVDQVVHHLRTLHHVEHHVLHVAENAGPSEQIGPFIHHGVALVPGTLLAHGRIVEDVGPRPVVLLKILDRLRIPNRRMHVHVVAAVVGLQVLGADPPVIFEHAVVERLERRADVPRLQPPHVHLQPAEQALIAVHLQMFHHVAVHLRLRLVVGGGPIGALLD